MNGASSSLGSAAWPVVARGMRSQRRTHFYISPG